jgi:predicted alpha/beta superfamily hydrolase
MTTPSSTLAEASPPELDEPAILEPTAKVESSTLAGDLRYHLAFESKHLGNSRTLVVYLPPGYHSEVLMRYPVLYLHDGQNVFDPTTSATGVAWQANDTAELLIAKGRIQPIIMVAVYNTPQRMDEYTPHHDPAMNAGGKGALYGRFLFEEVKPFIDREYRTLPDRRHTAVAGSSLGGLITLGLAFQHHTQFAFAGLFSPSLWWCKGSILKELEDVPSWLRRMKFWIDFGTKEGTASRHGVPSGIVRTRQLQGYLDTAGLLPGHDYYYTEIAGGEHNEAAWAARFDKLLLYFFGQR